MLHTGSLLFYLHCQTAAVEGWRGSWPTGWLSLTSWPPVWSQAKGSSLSQTRGRRWGGGSPQTAGQQDEACRPFSAKRGQFISTHADTTWACAERTGSRVDWLTTQLWKAVHEIPIFLQLATEWWDNESAKRLLNIAIVWNFSFIHSTQ